MFDLHAVQQPLQIIFQSIGHVVPAEQEGGHACGDGDAKFFLSEDVCSVLTTFEGDLDEVSAGPPLGRGV